MEKMIERMIELGGKLTVLRENCKRVDYTMNGVMVIWDDYNEEIRIAPDPEDGGRGVSEDTLLEMMAIVRAIAKEMNHKN